MKIKRIKKRKTRTPLKKKVDFAYLEFHFTTPILHALLKLEEWKRKEKLRIKKNITKNY